MMDQEKTKLEVTSIKKGLKEKRELLRIKVRKWGRNLCGRKESEGGKVR